MTTADEQGAPAGQGRGERGSINISHVQGAFAIGNDNRVTNRTQAAPEQRDKAQEDLLVAVRELRTDLARLVASAQRDTLDAELAHAEADIEESGAANSARRERLGRALAGAGALTGFLASAATVTQALGAFSGS